MDSSFGCIGCLSNSPGFSCAISCYCSVRLCQASGHFLSKRFLVIMSTVFHSFGQALGGVMRQL